MYFFYEAFERLCFVLVECVVNVSALISDANNQVIAPLFFGLAYIYKRAIKGEFAMLFEGSPRSHQLTSSPVLYGYICCQNAFNFTSGYLWSFYPSTLRVYLSLLDGFFSGRGLRPTSDTILCMPYTRQSCFPDEYLWQTTMLGRIHNTWPLLITCPEEFL